jgi:hypothetical protein
VLYQQKSLESQLKSLEGDMLADGQAAVKLQELQRDAEANRNIYEQFLSRFKTTNEQRLLQTSQAKVVSSATAPTRPTRPPLALIVVALAIGALLSSAAVITLLEAVGGSATGDSAETDPDPEPAEVVSPLNPPDWNGNSDLAESGVEKSVWRATMLHEGAAELSCHLRELLETIVVMPGQRGKVVLVTSGETGVGKSAVARSLNSLAVERGMLSVLIEILPEQVLLRARQGRIDEGVTDRARALRTDARSVNLLLETSQTVAVAAFPGDVRTEFDLIVIDAPALTEQSDVAALLAHADFTILVARDGATNPGAIDRARAALSGFGNSLIGIVINKTDDKVDARMATVG